jgi:hypothetical protein
MPSLAGYSQSSITVGQPISSTLTDERNPYISGDGKTLIFEQVSRMSDRPELLISFMENNTWSRPEPVPAANMDIVGLINGGYSLNFDGTRLYFHSARKGGLGGADIWYMDRTSTGNTWTAPQNLIKPINTTAHETYPNISPYGEILFYTVFTSGKTANGNPCGKIMMAKKKGKDNWEAAIDLPASINSGCSCNGKLLPDGQTFVFSSQRTDSKGGYDLYTSTWDGKETWSTPRPIDLLNTTVDNLSFSIPSATNLVYTEALDKSGKGFDIVRVMLPASLQPENTVLWTGNIQNTFAETGGVQVLLKNIIENQEYTLYYSSQQTIALPLKTNVHYVLYFQAMKKGFTYDCMEAFVSNMSEKIPTASISLTLVKPGVAIKTTTLQTEEKTPSSSYSYEVKQLAFLLKYNSEIKLELTDYYIKSVADSTTIDSTNVVVPTTEPSATILYRLYQDLLASGIDRTRLNYRREESGKEDYSIKVK